MSRHLNVFDYFTEQISINNKNLLIVNVTGLVVLAALVPNLDATITVAVVAPVIALTAAEVSLFC